MNKKVLAVLSFLLMGFSAIRAMHHASGDVFLEKADFREFFFKRRAGSFCARYRLLDESVDIKDLLRFYSDLCFIMSATGVTLIAQDDFGEALHLVLPSYVQFCVQRGEFSALFFEFSQWNRQNHDAIIRNLVKCYVSGERLEGESLVGLRMVRQSDFDMSVERCIPDQNSHDILQAGNTFEFALAIARMLDERIPRDFIIKKHQSESDSDSDSD